MIINNYLTGFFAVVSLHFLGLISPGPDFILVMRNSFLYPTRTALFTSLGVSLGIVIHISYCLLGLAILITKSPTLFTVVKYLGAAYLFYIGVKALLAKTNSVYTPTAQAQKVPQLSDWQGLKQGFLCNVLNPKASLFLLGIFTLAIKPSTPIWVQTLYGAWMVVATFLWFGFISVLITHPVVRQRIFKIQPFVIKGLGVLLILFALDLALFLHHGV